MFTALPRLMTVLALAATALVACASPRGAAAGSASITAADVDGTPPPAAREASPPGEPDAPAKSATSGQPACRVNDAFGVTNELHLTWEGNVAKGFLRRLAPSGMTEDLPVRAERDGSKIIVDAPNETDLTAHVAVVGEHAGKRLMRVGGEGATWLRCE